MQATDLPPLDSTPAAAFDVDVDIAALADWLRLEQTPGVGLLSIQLLLEKFHTPQSIFSAKPEQLSAVLGRRAPAGLLRPPAGGQADELARQLDAILAWRQRPGNHVLTPDQAGYPEALRQLPDAPLLLYLKGRPELLLQPSLAVVGARNASTQGRLNAERMARALSEAGLTIVSGLALGIDAAAHAGGLCGPGGTIAVVGTGADRIYPARNSELARRIAVEGCIVSEYPLGTPPMRSNFPKRNRLISGLARGVLVVEAAALSGSLITARLAASQGRELYAIPGSIHSTLSKGCHILIREEGAKLVEQASDILVDMGLMARGAAGGRPVLDDSFVDIVLDALGGDPATVDLLAERLGQDAASLQSQLLALELAGLLERLPGGMFQRLHG